MLYVCTNVLVSLNVHSHLSYQCIYSDTRHAMSEHNKERSKQGRTMARHARGMPGAGAEPYNQHLIINSSGFNLLLLL